MSLAAVPQMPMASASALVVAVALMRLSLPADGLRSTAFRETVQPFVPGLPLDLAAHFMPPPMPDTSQWTPPASLDVPRVPVGPEEEGLALESADPGGSTGLLSKLSRLGLHARGGGDDTGGQDETSDAGFRDASSLQSGGNMDLDFLSSISGGNMDLDFLSSNSQVPWLPSELSEHAAPFSISEASHSSSHSDLPLGGSLGWHRSDEAHGLHAPSTPSADSATFAKRMLSAFRRSPIDSTAVATLRGGAGPGDHGDMRNKNLEKLVADLVSSVASVESSTESKLDAAERLWMFLLMFDIRKGWKTATWDALADHLVRVCVREDRLVWLPAISDARDVASAAKDESGIEIGVATSMAGEDLQVRAAAAVSLLLMSDIVSKEAFKVISAVVFALFRSGVVKQEIVHILTSHSRLRPLAHLLSIDPEFYSMHELRKLYCATEKSANLVGVRAEYMPERLRQAAIIRMLGVLEAAVVQQDFEFARKTWEVFCGLLRGMAPTEDNSNFWVTLIAAVIRVRHRCADEDLSSTLRGTLSAVRGHMKDCGWDAGPERYDDDDDDDDDDYEE